MISTLAFALLTSLVPLPQEPAPLAEADLGGLQLRALGPALMSGRIADIAIDPQDQSTWYVGVGSGGVWKTTNAGTTWTPIFEREGSYSIGCVTIDPHDRNTIWVGTGENVSGRHVGYGDGVYRSRDGGASWENMGLRGTEHIGTILIHPENSEVIHVAAQGPLWSPGGERGLFRSVTGGRSWEKVLGEGDFTGCNEVHRDPDDPQVLYAATHQRYRTVAALIDGGPGSGIHKSTDGGSSWRELTSGLPEEDMGKIGLAISPQDPSVVYATIELGPREGGFWRSLDGGETWEKRSDYLSGGTGPHYYQELFASPHRSGRVYQMDVWMHVTEDGGANFRPVGADSKHSDNHALAFDPQDPNYLLAGSDGGLYESWDLGKTWKFVANLPVTQFYKIALDDDLPFYNVYGGTQDNSTQGGPSRTKNVSGIRNSDWFITLFADGHQPAVEPGNPDIVYSEWQEGNLVRYDRRTGEIVYIQPQPAAGEAGDRFNWDAPILISPHEPQRLYYASQRVWRSDDRGDSWRSLSGDLTRGLDRLHLPMMGGRVQSVDDPWDLMAMSKFGTITSLAESPLVEGLLYVGTDDGRIQISEDGGASWRLVEALPDCPDFFFVNDLKADLFDADTVYAVVDDHKSGDPSPYLFVSRDRGRNWSSLRGDLPERHVCWRIVQDHVRPGLLFLGTEFGLFFTIDAGAHWSKLEGGVPNIPFRDLAIQRRENDLVGATFGRGLYVLDDYSALREISSESLARQAQLFPVRDAWWYIPERPLGGPGRAFQGSAFYVADNPPFGAVVTYHLGADLRSAREQRREREKAAATEGGDAPSPGWEALRAERDELEPAIVLSVRDARGEVVRRLEGPTTKGFHRVAWNLRYAPLDAWTRVEQSDPWPDGIDPGFLAPPGRYSVSLAQRIDGVLIDLGLEQSFEVRPLGGGSLPGATPEAVAAFQAELAGQGRALSAARAAVADTLERVGAIRSALARSLVGDEALGERALALRARLLELDYELGGDPRRDSAGATGPLPIARRMEVASFGNRFSTYGPTATHRASLQLAAEGLVRMRSALAEILGETLPALERELDAAGVPWTPGRGIPR